jgi:hypothetical protein
MNNSDFISTLFAHSGINPYSVTDYLVASQHLYQQGLTLGFTDPFLFMLKIDDQLDREMRHYLSASSRRMTRVNHLIQHVLRLNAYYGELLIPLVLACIHQTLLLNEWYELLPRFELARSRIQRRFNL